MSLAAVETGILAFVTALFDAGAVIGWADAPAAQGDAGAPVVRVSVPAIRGLGMDDVRRDFDAGAASPDVESVPTVEGQRVLTVTLQVTTLDQRSAFTARSVLEDARTRCGAPGPQKLLEAANLGLANVGQVVNAPYKADGRVWSRYALDVFINATVLFTDAAGATSTIERVGLVGQLKNTDGTSRPDDAFDVP